MIHSMVMAQVRNGVSAVPLWLPSLPSWDQSMSLTFQAFPHTVSIPWANAN